MLTRAHSKLPTNNRIVDFIFLIIMSEVNDANFERANMTGTKVQGVDFRSCPTLLDTMTLEGAEYDDHTKFPTGFDPKAHGMVYRPIRDSVMTQEVPDKPSDSRELLNRIFKDS